MSGFIKFPYILSEICSGQAFFSKIKKGSNSVNTADRVTILALFTSADGPVSMFQVSLNSLVHVQRYAPDKLLLRKRKREITP